MKRNWKKLSLIGVAIAALAACNKSAPFSPSELGSSGASELTSSRDGTLGLLAAPDLAGNGAPRGKHVYSWNLIGTPHDYQGGCGDGHRIFVEREANGAQIVVKNADSWSIADCNATDDHQAELHSSDLGHLTVYARILGKPGGDLTVCADLVSDIDGVLCSIASLDLDPRKSGQSKFRIRPDELFNAELEDLLWTVDTNKDFRIVQFRVYQE